MSREIRIVIADDHAGFRRGLRMLLETAPDLRIVAEAGDGETALAAIREHLPDVAVLDIGMPAPDGLEIVRAIRRENLPVQPVVLTMYDDEALVDAAWNAGARGYVLKDVMTGELVPCIRAAVAGR